MWVIVCDGFCSGGSSGSSRISSFSAPSALLSATPPAVPPSSLSPSRPPGVSGLLLLPSAPFPWPVSLVLALGSYLVVRGDSTVALGPSHFSVTPFLLSLPSGVVCCISSPFVLLCSAGLLCGFIWLCPFFHSLRFWPWWLRSSAWSFFCLSSAVWGFCDSFRPPLSVSGDGPAVPLLLGCWSSRSRCCGSSS